MSDNNNDNNIIIGPEEKKDYFVGGYITKKDKKDFEDSANKSRVNKSEALREAIKDYCKKIKKKYG